MLRVKKNKAAQAVAQANGHADALLALATKQAQANDLLSKSITPALVQYQLVQKLGPDIKVIMLPTGSNFILPSEAVTAK